MDTREVLLPRVLKTAGYTSGIFGKWDLGVQKRFLPLARGFDDFYGFVNTGIDYYSHCADCNAEYRDPSPSLFSFNNPVGACPECKGFGRIISIDYRLAMPDLTRSIAGGVVKPWQTGHGVECQREMMTAAKHDGIPTNVPFNKLAKKARDWVIHGEPDYGKPGRTWPDAWYGVAGYFRWLESKAYKMHVRVLLSRYRTYTTCPACDGQRFKPDSLRFKLDHTGSGDWLTLPDFYRLPIRDAAGVIDELADRLDLNRADAFAPVLAEVRGRLDAMVRIGLGYLTLDRPTRTLSGGETQRVNLTACLGSKLVNMLYVLDEPSVGLHPRDTERLVGLLENLRDLGNTLVVVEHETGVIRRADHVVDLGPERGERGGKIVYNGPGSRLAKCRASLTGAYLSGRKKLEPPPARAVTARTPRLRLAKFSRNNMSDFAVDIPLGRLVCVTGVSGSGKTTLIRDGLLPALLDKLGVTATGGRLAKLTGWRSLESVMMVDQSSLGRTPRSKPQRQLPSGANATPPTKLPAVVCHCGSPSRSSSTSRSPSATSVRLPSGARATSWTSRSVA